MKHRSGYAICPPKTVLVGVFTPTSGANLNHIVLFHHFTGRLVYRRIEGKPSVFNFISQRLMAVVGEALKRNPLQWRPTIGGIPLLAAVLKCSNKPALL